MYAFSLCYSEELNVEDQRRSSRDAGLRILAVAQFGGHIDLPSVADVHGLHGYDPSLDKVGEAEGRSHATPTGVKLSPIDTGNIRFYPHVSSDTMHDPPFDKDP